MGAPASATTLDPTASRRVRAPSSVAAAPSSTSAISMTRRPAPVRHTMHEQIERGRELLADGDERQGDVAHEHHRLEPAQRVFGAVGVARGQRPFVAGVHRLQHVERFGPAALADHDAVGSHPQRVADQVAHADLARALGVGRAGLEAHDVVLRQAQLGRVLDSDDAIAGAGSHRPAR